LYNTDIVFSQLRGGEIMRLLRRTFTTLFGAKEYKSNSVTLIIYDIGVYSLLDIQSDFLEIGSWKRRSDILALKPEYRNEMVVDNNKIREFRISEGEDYLYPVASRPVNLSRR